MAAGSGGVSYIGSNGADTTGTLGIINFAADVNRYLEDGCSDDEWLAAKQFTQQLYASLKELYPPREQGGVGLFASFSLETMLGVQAGQPCQATDWTRATAPGRSKLLNSKT